MGKISLEVQKSNFPERESLNSTKVFRQDVCYVFQNWSSKRQLKFCFDDRIKRPKFVEAKTEEEAT